MTPETFFENFDLLADAPNGVPQLRALILQLAVQGKLVPQDPTDEPASLLLERIRAEKARLVAEGKLKQEKPLPPIVAGEMSFELASGWEWVKLGELALSIQTGPFGSNLHKDEYVDGGIPVINPASIRNGQIVPIKGMAVNEETKMRLSEYMLKQGDIILGRRGEMGRCAEITKQEEGWLCGTGSLVLRFNGDIDKTFMVKLLSSERVKTYLLGESVGTTMDNLNQRILVNLAIPLPPLAEQRRIVAKVEQLMALCDELETRQQQRRAARTHLNHAALDHLLAAREPDEFAAHWQRLRENFDLLYDTPETIGKLRQAILQLAVQGKLVPQDPTDEPAAVLLERIRAEKTRLVAEGKLKQEKPLPPIADGEIPFELPSGWEWIRGNHVLLFITSGSRGWAEYYASQGALFLRIGNLDYDTIDLDLSSIQYVQPPKGSEGTRTRVSAGDVLISITGDTGMVGLVPNELPEAYINQHIALARPTQYVMADYIARFFTSPLAFQHLQGAQRGIKNSLGLDDIRSVLLPLPPLAEQRHIVAKVEQLMALCDELEAQLKDAQGRSAALLEAVVRQVLVDGVTAA